jgi:hypothetical protein
MINATRQSADLDSDDFRRRLEIELKRPLTLDELRLLTAADRILADNREKLSFRAAA